MIKDQYPCLARQLRCFDPSSPFWYEFDTKSIRLVNKVRAALRHEPLSSFQPLNDQFAETEKILWEIFGYPSEEEHEPRCSVDGGEATGN
jgi:hypothetical protein